MKKKTFMAATIILLAVSTVLLPYSEMAKAQDKTIVVPIDYPNIQDAVDGASNGDTVFVRSGIYHETLVIDKSIAIIGEDKQTTIIDGGGIGDAIQIFGNNVQVANFTVKNAGTSQWSGHGFPDSCIDVEYGSNITIRNNLFHNATVGVWSYNSEIVTFSENLVTNTTTMGIVAYACKNSTVENNRLQNCGLVGIHLDGGSSACEIINNTVTNCTEGICLEKSAGNKLYRNILSYNNEGLAFSNSNDTMVKYCLIVNNSKGISIYQSSTNNQFCQNSFVNNVQQVVFDSASYSNSWDNGTIGNYWSDYLVKYPNASEIKGTRIGNTSYLINQNNTDNFPLMMDVNVSIVPPLPSPSVAEFPNWIILPLMVLAATMIVYLKRRKR